MTRSAIQRTAIRSQLAQRFKNPVFIKEMRTRMRGNRTFILVTAHLLALCAITLLIYFLFLSSLGPYNSPGTRQNFGKLLFGLVIALELITITFIAPALTSGMIASERERQTYDLLRVTLLPARSLVMGKYTAALVFVLLLLFTAIPLQSPAFLIGGILPSEIWIAVLVIAATAISFCAVGLFLSSLFPRTLLATILSYAYAIFLIFGIPAITLVLVLLLEYAFSGILSNEIPLSTQVSLVTVGWVILSTSPLLTIIATEVILQQTHSIWWAEIPLSAGPGANELLLKLPSPWISYVLGCLLLSLLLLWLSVRRVKRVDR